jgi:hypothetical protein
MSFAYFIPAVFMLLAIAHACLDAYWIEERNVLIDNKRKKKESLYYISVNVALALVFFVAFKTPVYFLVLFPLFCRAALFDPFLNAFRGEKFFYEGRPDKPDSEKGVWDKLEKSLGWPVLVYRVIYLAALAILTLFYYLKIS